MPSVDPWIGPRGSGAQRLLQILRDHGPITRSEAARLTGMSLGGVRPLVAALIADGQLVERPDAGPRPGRGRGRPGIVLVPVLPDGVVIGLDFGHAHVAVSLADLQGHTVAADRFELDVDRQAGLALLRVCEAVRAQLAAAGEPDVRGVVAGVPGPVDRAGHLRSSTIAPSWGAESVAQQIADALGVPAALVDVENDARLGAVGERALGAARGLDDVVYVKASHGLGAGLILGGRLYLGAQGLTGEIGHAVVESDGRLCRCGARGCLETIVSVDRIREQLRYVLPAGGTEQDLLADVDSYPAAERIVSDAGRALGRALADVCNTLNPELIVLGGELARAGDALVMGVRESIRRFAQPAVADTRVRVGELGEQAQVLGAVGLAAERARERVWAAT